MNPLMTEITRRATTVVFEHDLPISMPVVGIDPSLTGTAMAVLSAGKLTVKKYPCGPLRGVQRLKGLLDCLLIDVINAQPQLAVIEGYAMGARNSHSHSLGELGGVYKLGLAVHGVPTAIAPPSCGKKAITGKGNAKKHAVILSLFKDWGFEIDDDDMADAVAQVLVAAMATGQITAKTKLAQQGVSKVEFVEPLPQPKVRHRVRPDAVQPEAGEEVREKSAG